MCIVVESEVLSVQSNTAAVHLAGGRLRSQQDERSGGWGFDPAAFLIHLWLGLLHGSRGVGRTDLHSPGGHLLPGCDVLGSSGKNHHCGRRDLTGATG